MWNALHQVALAFVPLLVAMDAVGVLPIYFSFTAELEAQARHKVLMQAVFTAAAVSLLFLLAGRAVFSLLRITEDDFRVAGGVVLLVLSVNDILFSGERRRQPAGDVGAVPLGVPLIIGPAALTTLLILVNAHGYAVTLTVLTLNLVLVWVLFRQATPIIKTVGEPGARVLSKVASLVLAAIAVMLIRIGLTHILQAGGPGP